MNKKPSKTVRLPVLTMFMLVGTLSLGAVTGAFMYATGDAVIEKGFNLQMVSHTEYRYGEQGQIIARLVDFQGNAVNVDNCTATILYPDKSKFVDAQLMSESVNITGDHYYEFTTPQGPEGVYEYQASCTWASGAQSQSVTNSFHLSSAFNSVLGNLTTIQTDLTSVQGNLTELSADLSVVNSSLSTKVDGLSTQLNNNVSTILGNFNTIQTNFSTVFTELGEINTTLATEFATIQSNFSTVISDITTLQNTVTTEFADLQMNVTQILDAIDGLNFTDVLDNQALILGNLTDIDNSLVTVTANQASLNATIEDTNNIVTSMSATLLTVNTTTTNTYNYVTGTLANNVQQVLDNLGIMNATLNRVETNTEQINSTVNEILANQEQEVIMTTFSG